jgi:hypothetical protein
MVLCRSLFVLFLFIIVLSVLLRFTASDYPFGIFKFWPLCCLSFDLRNLITPLVSQILAIVLSVLQFTDSDYPFGIFKLWPLCCLFSFDLRILITPLVSSNFGHCVVCSSLIYGFWLPFWYLQTLRHKQIEYTIKETSNNNHLTFGGFRMGAVWYIKLQL